MAKKVKEVELTPEERRTQSKQIELDMAQKEKVSKMELAPEREQKGKLERVKALEEFITRKEQIDREEKLKNNGNTENTKGEGN